MYSIAISEYKSNLNCVTKGKAAGEQEILENYRVLHCKLSKMNRFEKVWTRAVLDPSLE